MLHTRKSDIMRKRELRDEDYVNSISNIVDLLFENRRLKKDNDRAIKNILKDISMIKSVGMTGDELIQRLEETVKILRGIDLNIEICD